MIQGLALSILCGERILFMSMFVAFVVIAATTYVGC